MHCFVRFSFFVQMEIDQNQKKAEERTRFVVYPLMPCTAPTMNWVCIGNIIERGLVGVLLVLFYVTTD